MSLKIRITLEMASKQDKVHRNFRENKINIRGEKYDKNHSKSKCKGRKQRQKNTVRPF